jgi:hypothetical protein
MAAQKDASWLERKLTKLCPNITITVTRDAQNNLVASGSSSLGSFTEHAADLDAVTRDEFYSAVRGYFSDLDFDTARETVKAAVPDLPYPTLPLTAQEPSGTTSPDDQEGIDYIGCGSAECAGNWDVSYLAADGHLWDSDRISAAEENDVLAGYTVCNQCGRVYPNAHRFRGPMPTVARVDVSTDVWLDAIDLYNHRTFATEFTRPANQEQR